MSDQQIDIVEPTTPYLSFDAQELSQQRTKLSKQLAIDSDKAWLFVHAGSGGSANNLSLQQYTDLVSAIEGDYIVVLTAGPGEEEKATELQALLAAKGAQAALYSKNDGWWIFLAQLRVPAVLSRVQPDRCISLRHLMFRPLVSFQVSAQQRRYVGDQLILKASILRFARLKLETKPAKKIWRELILQWWLNSYSLG
ncbi:ADP-heptose-lipooligosaccharide heptosyltransferase II [Vibrio ponticus]|nr:ADP-heptose-lipooligosaccharide heptosyltransferase II [Vibrio ponticus]